MFLQEMISNEPSSHNQKCYGLFFIIMLFGKHFWVVMLGCKMIFYCLIRALHHFRGIMCHILFLTKSWWGQFFMILVFISLFEPIFMPVLLTKILLLYPFVFPMLKLKSLRSMYMPVPTEKSVFDNACSKAPWYLSILVAIE